MTKEEIIEMARLAGWEMDDSCVLSPQVLWYIYQEQLETFAKLVAAKEREACAKRASVALLGTLKTTSDRVLAAIRARGEA